MGQYHAKVAQISLQCVDDWWAVPSASTEDEIRGELDLHLSVYVSVRKGW